MLASLFHRNLSSGLEHTLGAVYIAFIPFVYTKKPPFFLLLTYDFFEIKKKMILFTGNSTRGSLQKLDFEIFWGDPPNFFGGRGDFNYTKRVRVNVQTKFQIFF